MPLRLAPVTPLIGAEVTGVDLAEPLSPPARRTLGRALERWKVLFFRDQHLTPAQHRDFAAAWGELAVPPFGAVGGVDEVVRFSRGPGDESYENVWHADLLWQPQPSRAGVLRCVECPPVGGDTLWADMAAAYDGLDEAVKQRIAPLVAVHDFVDSFGRGLAPDAVDDMLRRHPPARHPVVQRHPGTGRKVLFVNRAHTRSIVGLPRAESDALLARLWQQATVPEYQCRFRWQPGSLALWDNWATQHYAVFDYLPHRRVMDRATIVAFHER